MRIIFHLNMCRGLARKRNLKKYHYIPHKCLVSSTVVIYLNDSHVSHYSFQNTTSMDMGL